MLAARQERGKRGKLTLPVFATLSRAPRNQDNLSNFVDRDLHHHRPQGRHPYQKCAQILKGAGARGGDGGERGKQL